MSLSNSRRSNSSAAALIALSALLGSTAIPAHAEGQPAQQNAAPAPESGANPAAPQQGNENRKSSGTNDQSGPSSAAPTTSQDGQADKAVHSTPGRAGAEEPGSHAPSQNTAVLVNGAWNVPGAPADGQTVPAKFSKRNDAIDKLPIFGMSLGLSDEQKRAIVESVRAANAPVANTRAKVAEELPWDVTVNDLPASANDPALAKLKYVRAQGRVLLIEPSNRIVIGEIQN
jgi:hypothetical protein